MIRAVFLLCLTDFTIMDMEFRRIHQAIERSERRTKKLQRQLAVLHFTEADEAQNGVTLDEVVVYVFCSINNFKMVHYFCLSMFFMTA